jgi:hypothetical protein
LPFSPDVTTIGARPIGRLRERFPLPASVCDFGLEKSCKKDMLAEAGPGWSESANGWLPVGCGRSSEMSVIQPTSG